MIDGMLAGIYRQAAGVAASATAWAARWERWRPVGERLGALPEAARTVLRAAPVLWIHAASMGELRGVRPLIGALRAHRPGRAVLVTTLTRTGLALARDLPEVDVATLLPLDAPRIVADFLDGLRLDAFCFTETEIWPTLLDALAARGVPAFMVSGRVSARTVARARWLRSLYAGALRDVECCMQTAEDAARIVTLGAVPARVHVAGSLKFEQVPGDPPESVRRLAARLAGRRLWVAGSTHAGEDEAVLDAQERLVETAPDLVLLLAPRHPERLDGVSRLLAGRGWAATSYEALTAGAAQLPERRAVVLLDVMGPLGHCYGLGVAAFVGGSLVPVGGHNVLEPARAARPVLVGPHTAASGEAVAQILAAGGGRRVGGAGELAGAVAELLAHPAAARAMGERAREAIAAGEGALARHLAVLDARLGQVLPARVVAG
jgi:3-deoxy-D-manno-octulosonic-acid transferase